LYKYFAIVKFIPYNFQNCVAESGQYEQRASYQRVHIIPTNKLSSVYALRSSQVCGKRRTREEEVRAYHCLNVLDVDGKLTEFNLLSELAIN